MKTLLALVVSCLCASLPVHAVGISGQGTWETTLQARDLDGNLTTTEAYYDTVLGITWLADVGYFGIHTNWLNANSWVNDVNPHGSGVTGWRLPNTTDMGIDGCIYTNYYQGNDCGYNIATHSELSHMFYVTLGNLAQYDTTGAYRAVHGLTNTGVFSGLQPVEYWSNLEPSKSGAWYFSFGTGLQSIDRSINYNYTWAVHDGDVGTPIATSAVPLPASVWLLGCGLLGLLGVFRKRKGYSL